MKKANFTTTPFQLLSQVALVVLMVCSGLSLQAQCGKTYFDTGGSEAPYNDGDVQDIVVCPDDGMTQYVRITFNQYDLAAGDVLEVFDGLMPGAPLLVSTGAGSSVADSPGGGWVDASSCQSAGGADINSGCLTVRFTPNGDNVKGAGFAFTASCFSKDFSFPAAGTNEKVTRVTSTGEFCNSDGFRFFIPFNVPSYSDCQGGSLLETSDCGDFAVVAGGVQVPLGETTITFTSPLFPSKSASYTFTVLPPSLACNDEINVSLLNECTVALTPDLVLEDPCETAFLGNDVSSFDYTIDFTDEYTDLVQVGTTVFGYPIIDFSSYPCGTKLDVKVTRLITTVCGDVFEDACWGQINLEDKVDPVLEDDVDDYTIPCFVAGEDFLDRLNAQPQDGRAINFNNLRPLRATGSADMYNIDLFISSVSDAFPFADNCLADYDVSAWQQVDFDCTTGGFDLIQSADDPLWDLMVIEFGAPATFRAYFRTVTAVDKCGNHSNIGVQRVLVSQPDIVHPLIEISLPCGADIDPIALYDFWAADPDWRKEYACFIPTYDPTPLDLNGNFGFFAGLDDTYFTNCSGDEVPAYPDHADCGYAIDWDDSEPINTCANSFKVFREWTVYNWCDGHLELIDVIPQVIKVGDTKDPELNVRSVDAVAVGGGFKGDCVADAIITVDYKDDCSGNVRAYVDFNNGLAPEEAEFDITSGEIRVKDVPILENFTYDIRLIDDCGNSSEFGPFNGFIVDNIPPVAICESFHTISMGIECEVTVPAEVFDDGSFDNCGTVSFTVARMSDVGGDGVLFDENFDFFFEGDEPIFQPHITFTKEDLAGSCDGTITVVFRVEDGAALDGNGDGDFDDFADIRPNSNFCMVEVELQDKIPPSLTSRDLFIDCDDEDADDFIQAALSDNSNAAVQELLNTSGVFSDPASALYIRSEEDNCDNARFLVDFIDVDDFDATCRQGVISIAYQTIDACGNASFPGFADVFVSQRSDWKMNFPMDAEVFCEDNVGLPAAATVDEIVTNFGCDFWGLEVTEDQFDANDGACFKVIREYQLINWCVWNPNNTEVAVVERPDELILDPIHTVSLRYQDKWNNALLAAGDCTSSASRRPDGINDIDDGNEDFDFLADQYGNACPASPDNFIYNTVYSGTRLSYEEVRSGLASQNNGIDVPLEAVFVGRTRNQATIIGDVDEAEDCDVYDVTSSDIDGDWVVIDFGDATYNYDDVLQTNAVSQFTNVEQTFVSAQDYGNIVYRQIIKVNDVTAPTVDVTQEGPFCGGYDDPGEGGICTGEVNVKFTVTDLCSENLDVTYELVAFDGTSDQVTISQSSDSFGGLNADGGDYSITGSYPLGTHKFVVTVSDNCSNTEIIEIPFTVNDCKAPVAYCIFGLAADLMGPGSNGASGEVTLWAEEFDAGSFDFCSDVTLTFADPTVYPDSTARTFRCEDGEIGVVAVELWVQDAAGNTAFCETFVNVQANPQNGDEEDVCPSAVGATAMVSGAIETEVNETVENVEVTLSGNTDAMVMTGSNGYYQFANLEAEYDYSVSPFNNENPLNGVSTFDLVLISKHILNVETLDSPYKIIAADVNNSRTVTTFDMVQLRKVILGIDSNFPGNTSWRFVETDHVFSDPSNPFADDFKEFTSINDIQEGATVNANFVAIKVGDVNLNASPNATLGAEGRNVAGTFAINADDAQLTAGEEMEVEFTANLDEIAGYQFTMNLAGLEVVKVLEGEATDANFGIFDNAITASWNDEAASNVAFTLLVRATENVTLSDAMTLTSGITASEAYNNAGEAQALALNFNKAGYALGQNNPNPFKGETNILVTLPSAQKASIRVHDVTGKVLKVITQDFDKGTTAIKLNSKNLQAGVLYYTLEADNFTVTKKMVILD
ncbi:MAG: T9SS type A sorting domain-containing protein [Bacteroidota bacterium]